MDTDVKAATWKTDWVTFYTRRVFIKRTVGVVLLKTAELKIGQRTLLKYGAI